MNIEQFEKMTNDKRKRLLQTLVESKGWDLLKFWIEYEEIEAMERSLLEGADGQTIEDIKLTRSNLGFAKLMLEKPYELIDNLLTEIEQSENPTT